MLIKANAKINLTLDVVGKRDNGYHNVEMIMQEIDLHDEVYINSKGIGSEILFTIDNKDLPNDDGNIAYRAAKQLKEKYLIEKNIEVKIVKKIPLAAGLAGGSADAAAVIKGMNIVFDLKMSLDEMMQEGLKLGADVPFCILGGCAIARGIGEELTPIKNSADLNILLVKPPVGVSTENVYKGLDYKMIKVHPDTQKMQRDLLEGDECMISQGLVNILENVTIPKVPVITKIKEEMIETGALNSLMSGSGPSVFSIYSDKNTCKKAFDLFKETYDEVYIVNAVKR